MRTHTLKCFLFGATLFGSVCLAAAAQQEPPRESYQRTFETPYMYQKLAQYAGDGSMFCAPTSSTMGIAWLSNHGYPNLVPKGADRRDSLRKVVETLASEKYMNTGLKTGTSTTEVISGLRQYISDAGYQVESVEYAGIRPPTASTPCQIVGVAPDLELLRKGLKSPTSIDLLNVGYYNRVGTSWKRMGGHWVFPVGYGTGESSELSDQTVLVHNPAMGAPKDMAPKSELLKRLSSDTATLAPLGRGGIVNSKGKIVRKTLDLFTIEGPAIPKAKKFDATVVEGVVVVTLAPAQRQAFNGSSR